MRFIIPSHSFILATLCSPIKRYPSAACLLLTSFFTFIFLQLCSHSCASKMVCIPSDSPLSSSATPLSCLQTERGQGGSAALTTSAAPRSLETALAACNHYSLCLPPGKMSPPLKFLSPCLFSLFISLSSTSVKACQKSFWASL